MDDPLDLRSMGQFAFDDIPSHGHQVLARKRELLRYARIAESEMPKLKGACVGSRLLGLPVGADAPPTQSSPSPTSRHEQTPCCVCARTTTRARHIRLRAKPS